MHEAVGLFKNMEQLQGAVKELERTDFPRDSLSVLAEHKSLKEALGNLDMQSFEEDEYAPREALVRSEEKVLGVGALVSGSAYLGAMGVALAAGAITVPAIITAAAIGGAGGAAAGGILAKILGHHFDQDVEEQIEEGGLLLWVRTPDEQKEQLACKILTDYGADHVRIHEH